DVDEVAIAEPAGAAAAPAAHDPALEQRAVEPAARGDLNHGLGSEQGVDRRHLAGVVSDVVLVADTQRSGAVVSPATDLTGLQDRAVVAVGGREVDDRAAQIDQRRGYLA